MRKASAFRRTIGKLAAPGRRPREYPGYGDAEQEARDFRLNSDKLSEIIAVGALLFIRATAAQSARSEDHDEEDAYLLARGSDDRRRLGHDDDGCIRPVAGTGWRLARRMEGWRMGTRSRGRGRRRGRDCRRDHRIPAAGLRGVP